MSIKNFKNPWEADNWVLQTDVLDTDVLNVDVLNNPFSENKKNLPSWQDVRGLYPTYGGWETDLIDIDSDYFAEKMVGGKYYKYNYLPDRDNYGGLNWGNTCAMRVSYALNRIEGHQISKNAKEKLVSGEVKNEPKYYYIYKVQNMIKYLDRVYSEKKVTITKKVTAKRLPDDSNWDYDVVNGRYVVKDSEPSITQDYIKTIASQGNSIIIFEITYGNATGHATLFEAIDKTFGFERKLVKPRVLGGYSRTADNVAKASKIHIWILK